MGLLVAGFVYLRGYDLVVTLLPKGAWNSALATAGLSYLLFKVVHVIVDSAGGALPRLGFWSYIAYCLNFTTFLLGPIQRYQSFVDPMGRAHRSVGAGPRFSPGCGEQSPQGISQEVGGRRICSSGWRFCRASRSTTWVSRSVLLGSWFFYLYLYFDFSGYCDIVIGIGRLMGIAPPENFWLPFLSPNIAQYWLRVHRSLTEWLTDYVFHPVYTALLRSGLMRGRRLAARNVAIATTMIVAGVWHGTTLSFLLFGIVHAFYQVVYRTIEHVLAAAPGRRGPARAAGASFVGDSGHGGDLCGDGERIRVLRAHSGAAALVDLSGWCAMRLAWRLVLLIAQIVLLTVLARSGVDFVYRAF